MSRLAQPAIRTETGPAALRPMAAGAGPERRAGRPRGMRVPADWWDSPPAVGCPLSPELQSGRAARRLTRSTLRDWGLTQLAEDAEAIVGELVANAVTHGCALVQDCTPAGENLCLRLLLEGDLICAVLDPSSAAPALQAPGDAGEAGRGLHIVDALSDVWGWSPVAGRGKAVWAILFCR